jgi:hypothetical protein
MVGMIFTAMGYISAGRDLTLALVRSGSSTHAGDGDGEDEGDWLRKALVRPIAAFYFPVLLEGLR